MFKANTKKVVFYAMIIGVFLMLLILSSFVYGFIRVFKQGDINNNIFELIFLTAHLFIILFVNYFTFTGLRTNKSQVYEALLFNEKGEESVPARVISICITTLGGGMTTYALLALFGIASSFSFPIFLILAILNAGATLLLLGITFIVYPFAKRRDRYC